MSIAKESLKLLGARGMRAVLVFAGSAFFAQELGASGVGTYFLFEALLGILMLPADFGIRRGIEKNLSEGEAEADILTSGIILKTIPLVVTISLVLLFSGHINAYVGIDIAHLVALGLVLQEIFLTSVYGLKGERRVGETAILWFVQQIVWFSVGAALVIRGFGVYGPVYSLLLSFLLMAIWGFIKLDLGIGILSIENMRALFDFSKYNFINTVSMQAYNWIDILVIGWLLTEASVGIYEIAWRLTMPAIMLSGAISSAIFPQISNLSAKEDFDKIESLIHRFIMPSVFLVIPSFVGLAILSKEVLRILFGAEYVVAWFVVMVLMVEKVFHALTRVVVPALVAMDHPDLSARASTVSIVTNVTLNIVLLYMFRDILGAAVATTVAFIVYLLFHIIYLTRFISIRTPYREIGGCAAAAAGMGGVLLILTSVLVIESYLDLAVAVGTGVLSYGVFVLAIPTLRTRVLEYTGPLMPT